MNGPDAGTATSAAPPLEVTAAVAAVWERHSGTVLAQVLRLEDVARAMIDGTLGFQDREEARRLAHRIAGSAGTFGFPEASRLARQLERSFEDEGRYSPDQARRLSDLIDALRRELPQPSSPVPRTERETDQSQPLLLVVDHDRELGDGLRAEASGRGMRCQLATDVDAARRAVAAERPAVTLLSLALRGGSRAALDLLAELSSLEPPMPVLVLTASDALTDRVEVARLGGRGFLQKPLAPAPVLDAVGSLLARLRSAEVKVLALDDDRAVLDTLGTLLAEKGMAVTTSDDPLRFWSTLEETLPDLLILDVDMPHVNGVELCRVVRNEPRWSQLPILFLTAHTDQAVIHRLFAAGADDYVSKPILGPELVTRITSRLERVRLYRTLAETDALTGVANRSKSAQTLDQLLRLADRYGQPVSFALLDLDHFKQVNDRYGHAVGDTVLRGLGGLLRRIFRAEDVIARWGGEEFVLGMHGMSRADGMARVAQLQEILRGETFAAEDGETFAVTFSAGVAQYPEDGGDVQALYRSADQALYRAKAAGRARVHAAR